MATSPLRQRAAAATKTPKTPRTEPSQPAESTPSLTAQVKRMEGEFEKAMPAGEARQFVRDTMTCLQTIKNLESCQPRSVLGALMTCAQLGLRPAVLGHAWPLPFWDRDLEINGKYGGFKAQLVIGYQGYIHLAYQSGMVASVKTAVVREEDTWEWNEAADTAPIHRRPRFGAYRGRIIGYYAVVRTTLGGHLVYAMDVPEMLAFRDEYAPRGKYNKDAGAAPVVGPWAADIDSRPYIGMALKTVLKYALKTGPRSPQLSRADAIDGTVRTDVSALSEPSVVSTYHHPQHPQQSAAAPPAAAAAADADRSRTTDDHDVDPTVDPDFGSDTFTG